MPSAAATRRAITTMSASTSASVASTVEAFSMWPVGMTRTWTGVWGLRSRKAMAWSDRSTMSAGRSPATMRQKMQSPEADVSLTASLWPTGGPGAGPGPLQLGVEMLEAPGGDAAGLDEPLDVALLES